MSTPLPTADRWPPPAAATGLLLGDAAKGTALRDDGAAPEAALLRAPTRVTELHRDHVDAGAVWVVTNTFGASRPNLERWWPEPGLHAIHRTAVECARAAAAGRPVLGSMGPVSGAVDDVERAYREQAEALAQAGVDGLILETILGIDAGRLALRSVIGVGLPVIACLTPRAGRLLDGGDPLRAAREWMSDGARAVGVNCGDGPASVLLVAERLAAEEVGPVYAAPNAGLPMVVDGGMVWPLTPEEFGEWTLRFRDVGVSYLAGCCGVTGEHLRVASRVLSKAGRSRA